MRRTTGMLALVLGVGLATGGASRAAPADAAKPAVDVPAGVEQEEVIRAPFTIKEIDRRQRRVVVESSNGTQSTVTVSPDAKDFEALQIGDQVKLDYYKASVLELAAPGAPVRVQGAGAGVRRTRGAGATARRGHEITTEAKVVSVDPARGTLQVATVDGRPQTMYVKSSTLKKALGALQAGDAVTVTYVEPMAVGLHRVVEK